MLDVGVVVGIASSVLIDLPYDIAAREWCGPVNCWDSGTRVYPMIVQCK